MERKTTYRFLRSLDTQRSKGCTLGATWCSTLFFNADSFKHTQDLPIWRADGTETCKLQVVQVNNLDLALTARGYGATVKCY